MGAQRSCQYVNSSQLTVCNWFFRRLVQFRVDSGEIVCDTSNRGKAHESRERNISVYWKSDNSVRARTPAFGLIGIRMVLRDIRLQTWTWVIVNRCIGKIIARDLSLTTSRLYWMTVTRPVTCRCYNALGGRDWVSLEMHLEAEVEWTDRCTWRPWSIEFGDALGGRDRASLEMHLEVEMEWTQRCSWRSWSSEFGHALGNRDRVNWEMHLEAMIEGVWRCTGGCDRASVEIHLEAEVQWTWRWTLRPWSSECGDALGGRSQVNSEMHFEAVIERVWRCNWRPRLSELRDTLRGRNRVSLEMHL